MTSPSSRLPTRVAACTSLAAFSKAGIRSVGLRRSPHQVSRLQRAAAQGGRCCDERGGSGGKRGHGVVVLLPCPLPWALCCLLCMCVRVDDIPPLLDAIVQFGVKLHHVLEHHLELVVSHVGVLSELVAVGELLPDLEVADEFLELLLRDLRAARVLSAVAYSLTSLSSSPSQSASSAI